MTLQLPFTLPRRALHPSLSPPALAGGAGLWLVLAGCGVGGLGPSAAGRAETGAPIAGTVALVDSSVPVQAREAPMGADGAYAVQVAGLQPPFLLRVAWADASGARQLYGLSEDGGNVDVNGFSDMAYRGACAGEPEERLFLESGAERKRQAVVQARALLTVLGTALAPLFERYDVADPLSDREAVRVLLHDVTVLQAGGLLLVVNRVTEDAIFRGPVEDPASGTFDAAGMPPGPGIPTCTAFTYSEDAACQADGTSTRTVLASSPAGCQGGKPETTRACVYVPPRPTCTAFTYSAYGPCRPDGTRARTVLSARPAGCTGGAPVTTQTCRFRSLISGAP
jgi:hypothetical protein